MERAGHSRHPRDCHAAGLRLHGGAQGVGTVPDHARADRAGLAGGRLAARGGEFCHQRAAGCRSAGRGHDCASGSQARELYRLYPRGAHHRPDLRQVPETRHSGAGRQGSLHRAGRRGHRRGGRGLHLWLLCQFGADLHVHRAHHRGRSHCRRIHRQTGGPRPEPAAGRSAPGAGGAGIGGGHGNGGTRQPPDRRCHRQGRTGAVRRQGEQYADARHAVRRRDRGDGDFPRGNLCAGQGDCARQR